MRRIVFIALMGSVVILGLAFGAGAGETGEKVTLKVQSALPTRLPLLDTIHFFADKLVAATNGNINVKVYDPGKLVPPFEIHDAVSQGQISAGYTGSVYISGKIRAATLFCTIPFGPTMTEYLSWFYEGNGLKLYQEMYDRNGYNIKVFPLYVGGMEAGGWFRKPINSAEDLKGLRVRWPGLGGKVLSKLGASVSTIPGSEIFPSLEKGVIDGTEFGPPITDTTLTFYKIAPYSYYPGWHQTSTCLELIINKKVWNSMSKAQQAMIEMAVLASNARLIAVFEALEGKTIKANAEKHGVKNMIYPDDVLDLLHKTWLEVVDEECAKDAFFKKVWDDLSAFRSDYQVWECHSTWALPPPKCK